MILKAHHINIVVKDLDEVVAFFRDILGLTNIWPIYENKGQMIDSVTGFSGTHIRGTKIELGEFKLEFAQYLSPPGKELKGNLNDAGIRHICLQVDDIEGMYKTLTERGVRFISPPVWVTDETHPVYGWGAAYFWGPEDIILELMQAPK